MVDEEREIHFCVNCANCDYQEASNGADLSKCMARENMELDLVTGKLIHKENRKYCINVRKFAMASSPQCRWFISK